VLFLRFEDPQKAIEVLGASGYRLLTDEEVRKL